MKKFLYISALYLLFQVNLSAQDANQIYTDSLNYIFQHVNKSKITTGLLIDYGLQTIDPEAFNGLPTDSSYVDINTWKTLYSGIYSSIINVNAYATPKS